MPNKTENYQLNQWEPEDNFLREDFNADNAALETALTAMQTAVDSQLQAVFGKYTGNAAYNNSSAQTITLGFRPKMVIVFPSAGTWVNSSTCYCAMNYDGSGAGNTIGITATGFTARNTTSPSNSYLNYNSTTYLYFAFK